MHMFRVIFTVHSFPSKFSVHRLVFLVQSTVFSMRCELYIYILILVLKADLRQLIIRRVLTTGNRLRSQAGQSEVCVG